MQVIAIVVFEFELKLCITSACGSKERIVKVISSFIISKTRQAMNMSSNRSERTNEQTKLAVKDE
jgi:hypothetical protein